jgi:hypothetical protein
VIDSSLITTTIKTLFVEIKNLRYNLTKIFEISFTSFTSYHSNVSIVVSTQRKTANSSLENVIQTSLITTQNEISIIFIDKIEFFELSASDHEIEFFELFVSSKKSEISFISEQIFFETKNISSKTLFLNHELDTSQMSLSNDRLTHQTSNRAQSSNRISRVQSKNDFFQTSHLINLREFFITQFLSSTFNSTDSDEAQIVLIVSSTISTFSEEYFENSSSIATRINYQSLQSFVQRNFDFLISILSRSQSKLITRQFANSAFIFSIEDFCYSNRNNQSSSLIRKDSTRIWSRLDQTKEK